MPFDEAAIILEFPTPYLSQTPMDQPSVLVRITSSPVRLYRVSINSIFVFSSLGSSRVLVLVRTSTSARTSTSLTGFTIE